MMVTRLTAQKGVDLVLPIVPYLSRHPDAARRAREPASDPSPTVSRHAAPEHPGRVAFHEGYDEGLAHRLFAAATCSSCRADSSRAASPRCRRCDTAPCRSSPTSAACTTPSSTSTPTRREAPGSSAARCRPLGVLDALHRAARAVATAGAAPGDAAPGHVGRLVLADPAARQIELYEELLARWLTSGAWLNPRSSSSCSPEVKGADSRRSPPIGRSPPCPFGGSYRIIDFVLSNFANAGYPEDRRTDPVQEPQPRPAHQPDLAVLDAARQLRDPGAGPDAPRTAVVLGFGRRDLPEPQPDLRRAPRHRLRLRRRSHLPHGSPPDGRAPRRVGRRRDRRGHPGVGRGGDAVRRHRSRRRTARSSSSTRSRRCRRTMPGDPTRALASMGNYVFSTDVAGRHRDAEGRRRRPEGHRRRRDPRAHRGGCRPPLRLLDERHPRARPSTSAATGATSGRSTPTTRPTWTCSPRCRTSASTTPSGPSTASSCRSRRPSWPTARSRPAGAGVEQPDVPGSIVSGALVDGSVLGHDVFVDTDAKVTESILFPGVTIGPGRQGAALRDRQERRSCPRLPHRVRPRTGPGPRLHDLGSRHRRDRQGS